jgi:hypothetical protein
MKLVISLVGVGWFMVVKFGWVPVSESGQNSPSRHESHGAGQKSAGVLPNSLRSNPESVENTKDSATNWIQTVSRNRAQEPILMRLAHPSDSF